MFVVIAPRTLRPLELLHYLGWIGGLPKGLAAVMTATLISYVGVDTFWGLVVGFKRLAV